MDATHEREQQADGELGDGMRRICGHARHRDAEPFCLLQVDVVEAGAAQQHHPRSTGVQRPQHGGGYVVVDEDADGPRAGRERRRLLRQPWL